MRPSPLLHSVHGYGVRRAAGYIGTMLSDRDADDGGGEIEALDEVLCGFGAEWARQGEACRHSRLQALLSDVRRTAARAPALPLVPMRRSPGGVDCDAIRIELPLWHTGT